MVNASTLAKAMKPRSKPWFARKPRPSAGRMANRNGSAAQCTAHNIDAVAPRRSAADVRRPSAACGDSFGSAYMRTLYHNSPDGRVIRTSSTKGHSGRAAALAHAMHLERLRACAKTQRLGLIGEH